MVAEVSNHDATYIMRKMPYAVGLQFRSVYWRIHGIKIKKPGLTESGSTRKMD